MAHPKSLGDGDTLVEESLLSEYRRVSSSRQSDARYHTDDSEKAFNEDEKTTDGFTDDPFSPLDGLAEDNENILTIRAVTVGVVCGAFVNASNIYLGLKTGWTASANLFASIVGYALLKSCPEFLKHMPFLGGKFGPRENNIVQTSATAAGGMSNVFTSAFPAMYQLGLLTSPAEDFWRLVTLTAVGGFFGLFFATPLRKFFIVLVARESHLIFPTPSATAITIRNMHQAADDGSSVPRRKMRVLSLAFAFAVVLRVLSQYAVGILWDWHPFTWYLFLVPSSGTAMGLENWGWFVEWSPAFIGTGMLVGLNVAISFSIGSLLAWGIIGPLLVSYGAAFGTEMSETGLVSYHVMTDEFTSASHPSPRYWLLWPAIACLVAVSLTELACQWRAFWLPAKAVWSNLLQLASSKLPFVIESRKFQKADPRKFDVVEDPASPEELVKTWMWLPGLLVTLILACLVMKIQYGLPIRETCLTLLMAFLFSFLAVQATGTTDITPLTAASTSSQVVLGAEASGQGWTLAKMQRLSLLGGALSAIGASQAADLTGDFRVGFLLRTSPKQQWLAQGIGTMFASFIAPGVYVLFASAYSCVNDAGATQCAFQVPSAAAWRAIAVAATDPASSIPRSSVIFAAIMAVLGSASALVRHHVWTGRWHWMRQYHPSMMVIAMAFIIPASIYATAILMGALLTWYWMKKSAKSFDKYGYAVAAGWIAGEGIGGVINAVMQIVGVSGEVFGTGIGCPGGVC